MNNLKNNIYLKIGDLISGWKDIKVNLSELNEEEFSAWINPLDFTQYADDSKVESFIIAPNDFFIKAY